MCGRFVVAGSASDLIEMFDIDRVAACLPAPSFNVAPTDFVSIILDTIGKDAGPEDEPVRRLESARWGLVPAWAKDSGSGASAINARIESASEKSTFATAVRKRRAIVPATGYYEWTVVDGIKTPHFIHFPDGELMVFAGLYEWWRDASAAEDSPQRWLLSTSILTREATGALAGIHDRMPVFLSPGLVDEWLDPHTQGSPELLDEISAGGAEAAEYAQFHEVEKSVGNVRSSGPALIEPVTAA